jgi:hypothetical protein
MKRNKLVSFLLIAVLVFYSTAIPVNANTTNLVDIPEALPALEQIVFRTATGDVTLTPLLAEAASAEYRTTAFSLANPVPLGRTVFARNQAIDSRLDNNLIAAILMYREVFTIEQIRTSSGLNVTEQQVLSAIQLALWRHALLGVNTHQIQEASVQDGVVRSLATVINTWATAQVGNRTHNTQMTDFIRPPANPRLSAQTAEMQTTQTHLVFGPYSFSSNVPIALTPRVTDGLIIDLAGNVLSGVNPGQTFFVALSADFSGTTTVILSGHSVQYRLRHSSDRVWLSQVFNPLSLSFNVGTVTGSTGSMEIFLFDDLTGLPQANTEIVIRSQGIIIHALRTGMNGRIMVDLPIGDYTLQVVSPPGFLPQDPLPFSIDFFGHLNFINLGVLRADGFVNFFAVNNSTLSSVLYAEALVYRDGTPIRRIAFNNGEALGFQFEPGEYSLSIYATRGGYSISGLLPFTVTAGHILDMVIPLVPNTPTTRLTVGDTLGRNNWTFQIYQGNELLFSVNNNGAEDFNLLPLTEYQVIARTQCNTHVLPAFHFVVPLNDSTVVVPVLRGTESVSFQFVDTVVGEPIPNIVIGVFDEQHRLIEHKAADALGRVRFDNLVWGHIYYVNVIAAPLQVSGYSAVGNRFMATTRSFEIPLYSLEYIRLYTSVDTLWRLPNVVWNGPSYSYPTRALGR